MVWINTRSFGHLRVTHVLIVTLVLVSIYLFEQSNRLHKDIDDLQSLCKLKLAGEPRVQLVGELNQTGLPFDIVPNIVHYILFQVHEIEFAHFISILSVLKNQKPEVIYIHCDCHQLYGDHYRRVVKVAKRTNTSLIVRYIDQPKEIFGQPLNKGWLNWHSSDIMRIKVLMEFGGIYLDRDVYVVRALNDFFKYEMSLNWDEGQYLGTQTLIAHKNSRFLNLWLQTFQQYNPKLWYFTGIFATKQILYKRPDLVHRVKQMFGADAPKVCPKIYKVYYKDWQSDFYAIHLVIRGEQITFPGWCFQGRKYPDIMKFNETVVKGLTNTFGEMSRIVLNFENYT